MTSKSIRKYSERFFTLNPKCRIIYGFIRSAIYNFDNGNVYSVNKEGSEIVKKFTNKKTVFSDKIALNFLLKLEKLGLGSFDRYARIKYDGQEIDLKSKPCLGFLWLEITSRCNLRCVHCYAGNEINKRDALTTNDWQKIISDARDLGCKSLQFIGGEPFLRDDIFDLINFAKRKKYLSIGIFTNATLLDKAKIKLLSDLKAYLKISLYSHDPVIHDRITKVNGSFSKTLNAIKIAAKYNVDIQIATIIMRQNQNSIERFRKLLKNINVEYRIPDVIRPTGRGVNKKLVPTNKNVKEMQILKKPNFIAKNSFYAHSRIWNNCWYGKLAIMNSGSVIPCIFARNQIIGNIQNKNLFQILNSRKLYKLWRITKDKVDFCRSCEYRYACKDCRPLSHDTYNDLYAKSPRCTYNPFEGKWEKRIY
jgi:radical SAM protein with 4Fe4S-binding SPASM domain